MFGLTQPQLNAVRSQAKKLNEAVDNLSKPQKRDDEIMKDIIKAFHDPVSTVIDKLKFVWIAGYIAGRVGKREDGEQMYD